MPNYNNTLMCGSNDRRFDDNWDEPHLEALEATIKAGKLCESAVPPSDLAKASAAASAKPHDEHDEAACQWGECNGKLEQYRGDGMFLTITFSTVGSPPHAECRAAIRAWLAERGVVVRLWVGSDPYDDLVKVVEDWSAEENGPHEVKHVLD
jgi:hypothetical protein